MNERSFRFYVVAIPDEYTILVNGGNEYNRSNYVKEDIERPIRIGQKVEVVLPGPEIIDPKTHQSLGYYDSVKEILEVIKIHDNFFECNKIKKSNSSTSILSPMFSTDINYIELDVNKDDVLPSIISSDSDESISVGDPVTFF